VVQAPQAPASSRHWNVEPVSVEVNVKLAEPLVTVPDGPPEIVVSGGVVSGGVVSIVHVRDAGEATLSLDVRDSVSGTLLARIIDRSTAQEMRAPATAGGQLTANPADSVTNRFWFDALYRQWADYCRKVIG